MQKNTENIILEIARKHFVQKGFAATRMQEIADEAGINKAMLHYYFRSKDKLYQKIIEQTLDMMLPRFAKSLGSEGTFSEKLERVVETYITTLMEHPEIPFFIMSEISQKRERFLEALKTRASFFPAVQSFLGTMMEDMAAGKIKQIPPIHLFLNIMGMTIFPFMAKPIFCTMMEVSEADFKKLMEERKTVILSFVNKALVVE